MTLQFYQDIPWKSQVDLLGAVTLRMWVIISLHNVLFFVVLCLFVIPPTFICPISLNRLLTVSVSPSVCLVSVKFAHSYFLNMRLRNVQIWLFPELIIRVISFIIILKTPSLLACPVCYIQRHSMEPHICSLKNLHHLWWNCPTFTTIYGG